MIHHCMWTRLTTLWSSSPGTDLYYRLFMLQVGDKRVMVGGQRYANCLQPAHPHHSVAAFLVQTLNLKPSTYTGIQNLNHMDK